jgi:hypothetical protein
MDGRAEAPATRDSGNWAGQFELGQDFWILLAWGAAVLRRYDLAKQSVEWRFE